MPPKKKAAGASAKTERKEKAKLIEDRTFGLKNKKKSTKVARFVEGVTKQVLTGGVQPRKQTKSAGEVRKEQKAAEKQRQAELDAIFKITKQAGETSATHHHYAEPAPGEEDEEYPDDAYFDKFFVEENQDALEEWIDKEREKVRKITPVTLETFTAWKEQKKAEKEAEERKNKKQAEEAYRRTGGGISGRDLFEVDRSIFVDDAEGVDVYEFENLEGIDVDEELFNADLDQELGGLSLEGDGEEGSGSEEGSDDEGDEEEEGGASGSGSRPPAESFYPPSYTPATWTLTKTPKQLLMEWCTAKKQPQPKFTVVTNTPGSVLVMATLPFTGEMQFMPEEGSAGKKEAEHNTALMVIRHLETTGDL